jgi:hypothetical protein
MNKAKTMSIAITKRCAKCLRDKPACEFNKHPFSADGLTTDCIDCGARNFDDSIALRIETPHKIFNVGGAVFASGDRDQVLFVLGRLRELGPDYLIIIKSLVDFLHDTLAGMEIDDGQ